MKVFEAKLDGLSKFLTGVMAPIFVLWPWILIISLRHEPDKSYMGLIIILGIVLMLLFAGCYWYMPKSYVIEDGQLKINRIKGTKIIPLSEIASADAISKMEMGFTIRIMGNGGIFGYTGFFTNKKFGRMNWFVTDKDKMIVIVLKDGKNLVVSPDATVGFLKGLQGK